IAPQFLHRVQNCLVAQLRGLGLGQLGQDFLANFLVSLVLDLLFFLGLFGLGWLHRLFAGGSVVSLGGLCLAWFRLGRLRLRFVLGSSLVLSRFRIFGLRLRGWLVITDDSD